MGLTQTTPPAVEPLSLTEAKAHCRVETSFTDDDVYLTSLIVAARALAERRTGRSLITQAWTYGLDAFPCSSTAAIELPKAPLQSVDAITYLDASGVRQTWDASNYVVETGPFRSSISLAYGKSWPVIRSQADSVQIELTVGYGDAGSDVDAAIRQGMLLFVGDMYRNREAAIIGASVAESPAVAALFDSVGVIPIR